MASLNLFGLAVDSFNSLGGNRSQRGFTLVEMGLVIFLISLLFVGSLRGAELINTADVKRLAKDFQNVQILLNTYQDKFRSQPGDDLNAKAHLGENAVPGMGNGVIDGNWHDSGGTSEASRTWQHFRLAGLMSGATVFTASDYPALNSLGYPIGLQSGTSDPAKSPIRNVQGGALLGTYIMCSRGIPGKLALSLDIQLDDGNPGTGSMLVTLDTGAAYTLGSVAATIATGFPTDIQPEQAYIVCMGF
jgi:hypothetical protein